MRCRCGRWGRPPPVSYKHNNRPPTPAQKRRHDIDAQIKACIDSSDGTHRSPRARAQLRRHDIAVSKETVEAPHGPPGPPTPPAQAPLQGPDQPEQLARRPTRPAQRADKTMSRRDFSAAEANQKQLGDFKQVDTDKGPVF